MGFSLLFQNVTKSIPSTNCAKTSVQPAECQLLSEIGNGIVNHFYGTLTVDCRAFL